jgi:serine kinase of HPr protein (carbohydrate metabolism regulator)
MMQRTTTKKLPAMIISTNMIEITKETKYCLQVHSQAIELTAQEINELHDKLTTFINDNYKELNP